MLMVVLASRVLVRRRFRRLGFAARFLCRHLAPLCTCDDSANARSWNTRSVNLGLARRT